MSLLQQQIAPPPLLVEMPKPGEEVITGLPHVLCPPELQAKLVIRDISDIEKTK
jgi:hypothetical protein